MAAAVASTDSHWRLHALAAAQYARSHFQTSFNAMSQRDRKRAWNYAPAGIFTRLYDDEMRRRDCFGPSDHAWGEWEDVRRLAMGATVWKYLPEQERPQSLRSMIDTLGGNGDAWFNEHWSPNWLDQRTMHALEQHGARLFPGVSDFAGTQWPDATIPHSSPSWIFMRRLQALKTRRLMKRADVVTQMMYAKEKGITFELAQLIAQFASAAVTPQRPLLPRMHAPVARAYIDAGQATIERDKRSRARDVDSDTDDEEDAKRSKK